MQNKHRAKEGDNLRTLLASGKLVALQIRQDDLLKIQQARVEVQAAQAELDFARVLTSLKQAFTLAKQHAHLGALPKTKHDFSVAAYSLDRSNITSLSAVAAIRRYAESKNISASLAKYEHGGGWRLSVNFDRPYRRAEML